MRALSFASQLSLNRLAMVGEFWTKRGAPPQSTDEAAINAQPHSWRVHGAGGLSSAGDCGTI
jgi:hypothetical protein